MHPSLAHLPVKGEKNPHSQGTKRNKCQEFFYTGRKCKYSIFLLNNEFIHTSNKILRIYDKLSSGIGAGKPNLKVNKVK